MSLKKRVTALVKTVVSRAANQPISGRLDSILAVPVGSWNAEDRGPGVYLSADGTIATVVFEGFSPPEDVMRDLKARRVDGCGGMVLVVHGPDEPQPVGGKG